MENSKTDFTPSCLYFEDRWHKNEGQEQNEEMEKNIDFCGAVLQHPVDIICPTKVDKC